MTESDNFYGVPSGLVVAIFIILIFYQQNQQEIQDFEHAVKAVNWKWVGAISALLLLSAAFLVLLGRTLFKRRGEWKEEQRAKERRILELQDELREKLEGGLPGYYSSDEMRERM